MTRHRRPLIRTLGLTAALAGLLGLAGTAAAHTALEATQTASAPKIDGDPSDAAWSTTPKYAMAYNQLDALNQAWGKTADAWAVFSLLYKDNTLYGIVWRTDDKDYTGGPNPWDSDGVEVFLDPPHQGASVRQIRAIIGQPFDDAAVQGAWGKENRVLEFAIPISGTALKPGVVLGFNIALNDGDDAPRDVQIYPVPGRNTSWNDATALGDVILK